VPYPTGCVPGQRYRIEQWAPFLTQQGIEVTFRPFMSRRGMNVLYQRGHLGVKLWETARGYCRRVKDSFGRTQHDLTYVYREAAPLAPVWLERFLLRGQRVVLDFDDALYLPDASPANAWAARLKSARKTEALCRLSTHVIVGNETLAGFAREHARLVTVVPSTVEAGRYALRPRPVNRRPIVGWTGSPTTVAHLRTLEPALRRLRERVDYELRVIGGGVVQMPGVDVVCVPWRSETEADDLRPLDVGVMPLPDDEWSRGKCGMKAIQYMALGIPPVVSPIGFNATLVEHESTGLHARTDDQWVEQIARLLANPELRAQLGSAGRAVVLERYTAEAQAARVAQIFREAAA
jgi:glycosyltransferase involved in cell wall biosynthesis